MVFELASFGDAPLLLEGGRTYTYCEVDQMGAEVAGRIGRRTLVFVVCTNRAACVAGYLGFLNAGIVPLLVEDGLDDALMQNLLRTYSPTHVWAPCGESERFPGYLPAYSQEGYELLEIDGQADGSAAFGGGEGLDDELALLVSTSGSTGTPKLVRLSARNIVSNADSIAEYLGIDGNERAITSLPMSYVYGLSVIHSHVRKGASLVLTELPCYTGGFWKRFEACGCTSFAGVPFMYEMLDKLKFTAKPAPEGLRTMTQAGGKLSVDLQDKFAAYAAREGLEFVVMYGASEATARMGYLPPSCAVDKRGSMGIAIPGGRFELVDVDGQVIAEAHKPGELVYYGDNVSLGYATSRAELALGDVNGGRLETGDIAERDEDGFYYVVGRKKRFIKMLGKRMNLDDVEVLLKSALETIDVACSGKDDLLSVFVVDETLVAPARDAVVERLQVNPRMVKIGVLPEIPKNASGKTLYAELPD